LTGFLAEGVLARRKSFVSRLMSLERARMPLCGQKSEVFNPGPETDVLPGPFNFSCTLNIEKIAVCYLLCFAVDREIRNRIGDGMGGWV